MRPSTLTLAFAALVAAVPSTYVVVEVDNEVPLQSLQTPSITSEKPNPRFDDSRIADYHDKKLLRNIRAYFKTFVDPNPEAMRDFQTEDYTMTDIRKPMPSPTPRYLLFHHWAQIPWRHKAMITLASEMFDMHDTRSRLRKAAQNCEKNVIVHTRSRIKSCDRQIARLNSGISWMLPSIYALPEHGIDHPLPLLPVCFTVILHSVS